MLSRARAQSSPDREVIFTAAAAFVSAEHTLSGEGGFSMPLSMAALRHATVATSCAVDSLFVESAAALGLRFVGTDAFDDFYSLLGPTPRGGPRGAGGGRRRHTGGSVLLTERLLRDAEVCAVSLVSLYARHNPHTSRTHRCSTPTFSTSQASSITWCVGEASAQPLYPTCTRPPTIYSSTRSTTVPVLTLYARWTSS